MNIILVILIVVLIIWVYRNEKAMNTNAELLEKLYDDLLFERDVTHNRLNRIENYMAEMFVEQKINPWKDLNKKKMEKINEIQVEVFPDMKEQTPNVHSFKRAVKDVFDKF